MKTPTPMKFSLLFLLLLPLMGARQEEPPNCGNRGSPCPEGMCCSTNGFCGSTDPYCAPGHCKSQCPEPSPPPPPPSPTPPPPPLPPPPPGSHDVSDIFPKELFEKFLLRRNDQRCPARGFYTYEAFIEAARAFPAFGNTGNDTIRKREIAAFFGQTSHETTGGWATAEDGPYAWGYCYKAEQDKRDLCVQVPEWPCVPGKKYYGRGPIQLSYNYNYGQAGEALGLDLLSNPDLVETDPVVSFKTAIWFWMTTQLPKPSCHDVMIGAWKPTEEDLKAGRIPGYGMCTNIINGGVECGGPGPVPEVEDRIGFYKNYTSVYGVSPGDKLDCYNMKPYPPYAGLFLTHASM